MSIMVTNNSNNFNSDEFFEKFGDPYINAIKRKVLKYFLAEFEDYLAAKCSNDMPRDFIDSLNLTKEQESKILLEIILEVYKGKGEHFPDPTTSIYNIQDYVWLDYVKGII